uniref:Uncharacterized protein n=1 Tax=Glossina austeni TaxID=7395 RepID=A0A1A9UV89_GLOAU
MFLIIVLSPQGVETSYDKFYIYDLGCGVPIKLKNRRDGSTKSYTTTARESKLVMEKELLQTIAHGSTCDLYHKFSAESFKDFLQRASVNSRLRLGQAGWLRVRA